MLTSTKALNLSVNKIYTSLFKTDGKVKSASHDLLILYHFILLPLYLIDIKVHANRQRLLSVMRCWDMNRYDWERTKVKPSSWSLLNGEELLRCLSVISPDRNGNDFTALSGCSRDSITLLCPAGLCIMIAASIYTATLQTGKPDGGFGHSYVLAWISFVLTLLLAITYLVLRKKSEWERRNEGWAVPSFAFGDMGRKNRIFTKIWGGGGANKSHLFIFWIL